MGKNIVAGFVGILVAVGLVWLFEAISHSIYPMPVDLDPSDTDALRLYIASLPAGAFLIVGAGWFVATLGGILVASRIGTASPRVFTLVVGGFMLAATAFNLTFIPHPLWFSIAAVIAVAVAAWLGMTLAASVRRATD